MGLLSGLKRIVDKGLHIASPRQLWSSGARHRAAEDLGHIFGKKLGGLAQGLNPISIAGSLVNPDEDMGESRGRSAVGALALLLPALAAAGKIPGLLAGASQTGPGLSAGANAAQASEIAQAASEGASAHTLAGLQRVAGGGTAAGNRFLASAGQGSQIPTSYATSAVGLSKIPVGQTNIHGLRQAYGAAQTIGRPVTRRAEIRMQNRQQDQQRRMYLAWLAQQQRPVFMRQPTMLQELLRRTYNGFA